MPVAVASMLKESAGTVAVAAAADDTCLDWAHVFVKRAEKK